MKKMFMLLLVTAMLVSCEKLSKPLSTEDFNYTDEIVNYFKPVEKVSNLVSIKKEIPLVNTKDFCITNKYMLPFLHYQMSLNNVDLTKITKNQINDFMYLYAYIFAKNELVAKTAMEKNISATDEEVNELLNLNTQGRIEDFKKFINSTGLSYDFTLKDTKQSLTIDKFEKDLIKDVSVTEEEMRKYFLDNPTISKSNPKVTARHILIKFNPAYNKEKAFSKIEKLRKDILTGKDFAEVAKNNSDDLATKNSGGKLGDSISRGDIDPDIERAAFNTAEGKVSEIVELPYGYDIVKVEKIVSDGTVEFDVVKEDIEKLLIYLKQESIIKNETERIAKKYNLKYWKV